jgi:hypothetical protein
MLFQTKICGRFITKKRAKLITFTLEDGIPKIISRIPLIFNKSEISQPVLIEQGSHYLDYLILVNQEKSDYSVELITDPPTSLVINTDLNNPCKKKTSGYSDIGHLYFRIQ